jgi:hypothetical protein
MLHRPISRALLAGGAFLAMMGAPVPALADTFYETYYLPTSSIVGMPTSSLLPTSYVVPTSYSTTYLPTSAVYTSDSFLLPTSTTYYRRSALRPRRYVETTTYGVSPTSYLLPTSAIVPTSYVLPTSYVSSSYVLPTTYLSSSFLTPTSYRIDNGVVTTSASYPCDTPASAAPPRSSASRNPGGSNGGTGNSIVSEPSNSGNSGERRPSATLNSSPSGDEGVPSNVTPPVPAPVNTPAPQRPATAAPLEQPPALDPDKAAPAPAPTGPGGKPNDSIQLPAPGATGGPTQPNETTFRKARRPTYDTRNILRGRVISADSRLPEEGVTVIASSLTRSFTDRVAMTDADGEFKVSLPDGDWTVKVKMPSGSIFTVGQDSLTASNGKVTNSSGRNVVDFLITR